MASDGLWIAADGNFGQVVPVSVVGRVLIYVGSVIGMLLGPAMMVTLFVVGAFEWQSLVGGVAVILTLGLFSLISMVSTMRTQRRVQRLRCDGRAAIADVVDSRSLSPGEQSGVEVTVRISGEGIATFEVAHRGSHGAIGRLGARFPVVVDPKDHAYMIVR
ncbi:hypothetical protein ACFVX3_20165 [Rhodococcus erythropolis]